MKSQFVYVVRTVATGQFVTDRRDGLDYVPKYRTSAACSRSNQYMHAAYAKGRYEVVKVLRNKVLAFEREINEKHYTRHARKVRQREKELVEFLNRRKTDRRSVSDSS